MNRPQVELFNEKVARLEETRLAARMKNPAYVLDHEKITKGEWIAADGIAPDDVDAFVLNLRLLVQDRDGISIRCLSRMYENAELPSGCKARFEQQRDKLHEHWASHSLIRKPSEQDQYTNKELFDIIMYGGLAHRNPDRLDDFRRLTSLGLFSSMVFAAFHHTLQVLLSVLKEIRDINVEVLNETNSR